ncbi:immunity 47 family protein [Clostridium estertheticum]|uniref:Immunity 47 family protein n=1 Tax=Clostridium estertheticum TaxID=238834 RepID=A0AA47EL16_9CLOT|nr:Imm47 family immunity protein [Clostridium estertheticum]MBU3157995.1 hypothetical protein [Clostridium estertheticum]MBU3202373.1 hypothetical protein [Clostridium estertheticum]WAG62162.1 immunity 47 family protein [Clostridium estertheticum]WAG63721.1 immunity 47 family protein [Clostridium estertheticum]
MENKSKLHFEENWYGNAQKGIDTKQLWNKLGMTTNEVDKFLIIIELLKLGDFSAKKDLIIMMNESKDVEIRKFTSMLFCSIANHSDVHSIEKFLATGCEDEICAFTTYSYQLLSFKIVPYLLALLEEWDDTYVEQIIRDALSYILDYERFLPEECTVDEIGELYLKIIQNSEEGRYYYKANLVFPGDLTKKLIEASAISRKNNKSLLLSTIPNLLSIWSGIECPVEYNTVVDDDGMRKVFDYVKQISKMNWEKGCKYFYGYKI